MYDKILQIIPAPAGMWAIREGTNLEDGSRYRLRERVVCLTLIEASDGESYVAAMAHETDGYICPVERFEDFAGIEYSAA